MDVHIEELPAFTVATAKARSTKAGDVGAAWGKLIAWLGSRRATAETPVGAGIGITEGMPGDRGRKYEAAWPVDGDAKGDRTIRIKATPAGTYAVARHEGHPTEVDAVYSQIVDEWLPTSGFKLGKGPMLALHKNGLLEEAQIIDACVPLESK